MIALAVVLGRSDDGRGTEEDVVSVERVIRDAFSAYNAGDVDRFLAHWTARGFVDVFGVTKEEAADLPPGLSGLRPLSRSTVGVETVSPTTVAGEGARARVVLRDLHVVRTFIFRLVRHDRDWLVDEAVERPSPVRRDTAIIPVELREYSIRLSAGSVTRSVAFRAANAGRKPHQLLLLRLDVALGTEESIGRIELLPPGRSWPLVLRGLEPGSYALVCNLLDDSGVPHSSRGMRVEFRVR